MFLLFTCISFTFVHLIPIYKQIIQKIRKNVKTSLYFFLNRLLLPKNTASETLIWPKQW